jgi:integrase
VKRESELILEVKAEPTPKPTPVTSKALGEHRTAFSHDKKTTYKKDGTPLKEDTITHYDQVTRNFLNTIKRLLPSEVTKQDLKDWIAKERLRVSHRTICNLYASVAASLMFAGVDHKKLMPQGERPTPQDSTPECYSETEMTKFFFNIVKERDSLAFEMFLKTGPRERELTNLEWTDLVLGPNPVVKFQTKEGFRAKTGKSRTVPLEAGLAIKLAEWRVKNPKTRVVFGTDKDAVEGHFLVFFLCVKVLMSQSEAEAEVSRLNQVNAGKRCVYLYCTSRLIEGSDSGVSANADLGVNE